MSTENGKKCSKNIFECFRFFFFRHFDEISSMLLSLFGLTSHRMISAYFEFSKIKWQKISIEKSKMSSPPSLASFSFSSASRRVLFPWPFSFHESTPIRYEIFIRYILFVDRRQSTSDRLMAHIFFRFDFKCFIDMTLPMTDYFSCILLNDINVS